MRIKLPRSKALRTREGKRLVLSMIAAKVELLVVAAWSLIGSGDWELIGGGSWEGDFR